MIYVRFSTRWDLTSSWPVATVREAPRAPSSPPPSRIGCVRSYGIWPTGPDASWAPDYPWGASDEYLERSRRATEDHWGTDAFFAIQAELDDYPVPTEATIGYGKLCRSTATPDVALELDRIWNETDVRGVLPAVRVPSLLLKSLTTAIGATSITSRR